MKRLVPIMIAFSSLALLPCVLAETPLGTDFTFQGQLKVTGNPFISTADFKFSLFDADVGGNQIGTTILKENTAIVSGLFTLSLDFGAAAFKGNARWIEIAVRSPAGVGGFTTLSPRQLITAAPNAIFSLQTRGITVDAAGNVGIGTTNPGEKLTVVGNVELRTTSEPPDVRIGSGFVYSSTLFGNTLNLGFNYLGKSLSSQQFVDTTQASSRLTLGNGTISLATQSGGTPEFGQPPINRLVITEFGNVGIGTSNPQADLHVNSSIKSGGLDTNVLQIRAFAQVFGGEQSINDEPHLIWKLGDYQTLVGPPAEKVHNPELKMISPVTGDELAGFYRSQSSGNGVMFADDKNFRAPNPADPATDIWYCCPEGPEAAMYVRGTARLNNGRAVIELPDHFRNLASEPGMTVQLTPRSLESKGLAISKASLAGIEVGELASGTGNYEFDWRVEAVRKGWEDYKVVRPWMRSDDDPDKAWQNRLKHIEERRAHGKPSPNVTATTPRPQE